MSSPHRKLYLLLGFATVILILLFASQWKRARRITTAASPEPLLSPAPVSLPRSPADQLLGNPGAALSVVIFLDLGDQRSRQALRELQGVIERYPREANLIFKDAPFGSVFFVAAHERAHRAAWCAGVQRQFWPFVAALGSRGAGAKDLNQAARDLGLELALWETCTDAASTTQYLSGRAAENRALGIKRLPLIFINNRLLNWTPDLNLAELVESFITR
ncbi:MAG: hypothetical protein HYV42_02465 [Candidatus Magasanikbacteria bacterium]|nr:hypothetical protein [Candidatus Magasanikbacteria bacterium]